MKRANRGRTSGTLIDGFRAFLIIGLTVLVGACASAVPKPEPANQEKLAELFAETFRRIENAHIEQTDARELALSGLRSLAGADEQFADEFFIVPQDGAALPGPEDYDGWGAATSEAVIGLVAGSERLRAMEPQQLYDLYAAGLAHRLAKPSEFFPGRSVFTVLHARTTRKFDMGYDLVADGVQVARLDPKGELEEQGLNLGDVITHIEGTPIAGLPKVRVFELLGSGLVFGSTTLTVRRAGAPAPITLDLWETTGGKYNLRFQVNEGVAEYGFVDVDYDSTRFMAQSMSRKVGHPFPGLSAGREYQANSILLDLRNTPDHPDLPVFTDTDAAVRLADLFLGARLVVWARSRHGGRNEKSYAESRASGEGYPIVIVVDGTTSGAAEIAAAALQDNGRALVVGSSTAGDGKLHSLVGLPTGGILVTPSAYAYSTDGYPIEERGVMPNICTSLPGATLDSLLAKLRLGQGMVPEKVRQRFTAPDDAAAIRDLRMLCPAIADSDDLARELGLAILRDPELYARLLRPGFGS